MRVLTGRVSDSSGQHFSADFISNFHGVLMLHVCAAEFILQLLFWKSSEAIAKFSFGRILDY